MNPPAQISFSHAKFKSRVHEYIIPYRHEEKKKRCHVHCEAHHKAQKVGYQQTRWKKLMILLHLEASNEALLGFLVATVHD